MRLGKCLYPSRSLPNESKSRIYQQLYGRIYPFDDLAAASPLIPAPITATRRARATGEGLSSFRTIDDRLLSLNHDGQIHARMDRTIELKRASSGEGTNRGLCIPIDLQIVHLRRM